MIPTPILIDGIIALPSENWMMFFRYLGYASILIGLSIYIAGLYQILTHTAKSRKLLKSGLYSIARHPQYLGLFLWSLGFAVLGQRIINYIMWLTLCYSYLLLSEYEEKDLIKKYGDEYEEYRRKVPFIIPNPFAHRFNRLKISTLSHRLTIYTITYVILVPLVYYIFKPYIVFLG
jgi:protein-S-isoprenylcysteine O-methyltransferase Ste14